MKKINLVILQAELKAYRVPLINLLSKNYNITVISHSRDKNLKCNFISELIPYKKFFFIKYYSTILSILSRKKFDVLVVPDHFEWISFLIIGLMPRKFPILWYGFTLTKNSFYSSLHLTAVYVLSASFLL